MISISKSLIFIVPFLFVTVDSACYIGSIAGVGPGESLPTTCNYHGWIISNNSSFQSPAPYCEECTCESGAISCCGYGWKGGPVGIPGCRRVIDLSTCDHIFVDAVNESKPCSLVDRLPATGRLNFPFKK